MKTLCCVNSSCLKWSCSCFRNLFGLNLHHEIKLAYFFLTALLVAVSFLIRELLQDPSDYFIKASDCNQKEVGW